MQSNHNYNYNYKSNDKQQSYQPVWVHMKHLSHYRVLLVPVFCQKIEKFFRRVPLLLNLSTPELCCQRKLWASSVASSFLGMRAQSLLAWLFVIPWTIAHQAPHSMGILQARILEWVARLFSTAPFYCHPSLLFSFLRVWKNSRVSCTQAPMHYSPTALGKDEPTGDMSIFNLTWVETGGSPAPSFFFLSLSAFYF